MLIQGDAFKILEEMKDKSVDHIITDFVYDGQFPLYDAVRVCKGNIITFCSPENQPFKPDEFAFWIKTPSTKNYTKHIGRFVEMILILRKGNTFNKGLHWSQYTGVYNDLVVGGDGHQWRKPLSLMERLVRIYTNPNDIVLDCFCGSGTTLEACRNLERQYIGIDIDQKWIDVCKEKGLK